MCKFCITTGLTGLLSAHIIVKTAKLIITTVIYEPNKWFCEAKNMRIDASRWRCAARPNVMPVQQQTNSVNCGLLAMAFLTCILFDEDPKTQRFDEKLLRESLSEQHIRCFQATENSVVKCKSKSISLELYCSCR